MSLGKFCYLYIYTNNTDTTTWKIICIQIAVDKGLKLFLIFNIFRIYSLTTKEIIKILRNFTSKLTAVFLYQLQ